MRSLRFGAKRSGFDVNRPLAAGFHPILDQFGHPCDLLIYRLIRR